MRVLRYSHDFVRFVCLSRSSLCRRVRIREINLVCSSLFLDSLTSLSACEWRISRKCCGIIHSLKHQTRRWADSRKNVIFILPICYAVPCFHSLLIPESYELIFFEKSWKMRVEKSIRCQKFERGSRGLSEWWESWMFDFHKSFKLLIDTISSFRFISFHFMTSTSTWHGWSFSFLNNSPSRTSENGKVSCNFPPLTISRISQILMRNRLRRLIPCVVF